MVGQRKCIARAQFSSQYQTCMWDYYYKWDVLLCLERKDLAHWYVMHIHTWFFVHSIDIRAAYSNIYAHRAVTQIEMHYTVTYPLS